MKDYRLTSIFRIECFIQGILDTLDGVVMIFTFGKHHLKLAQRFMLWQMKKILG